MKLQQMGKTSGSGAYHLPGRLAWITAEIIAPINFLYIIYTLPGKLRPIPSAASSICGTGLPIQHELLAFLYVAHYVNRAIIAPLSAPSVSPIAIWVWLMMVYFQLPHSANLASWIVYSTTDATVRDRSTPFFSPFALLGLALWIYGFRGNVVSEYKLYDLRRAAAKRKAKSEGKAVVTYEKVYVIPPAEGTFKRILYPHYVLEWVEWTGYWLMGGAWGLGWGLSTASVWFIISEVTTMLPRAVDGKKWYETRFGKRAVGGRAAAIPALGL
jgi:3-oxo-5-alpha-steroid 4-dehydrogenase 1